MKENNKSSYEVIIINNDHTYQIIPMEMFKKPTRKQRNDVLLYLFPDITVQSTIYIPVLPADWMDFDYAEVQLTPLGINYDFDIETIDTEIVDTVHLNTSDIIQFINFLYTVFKIRGYDTTLLTETTEKDTCEIFQIIDVAKLSVMLYTKAGKELKQSFVYTTKYNEDSQYAIFGNDLGCVLNYLDELIGDVSQFIYNFDSPSKSGKKGKEDILCNVFSLYKNFTWKSSSIKNMDGYIILYPTFGFNMFYLATPEEIDFIDLCDSSSVRIYTYRMDHEDDYELFEMDNKKALETVVDGDSSYYDCIRFATDLVDEFIEITAQLSAIVLYTRFIFFTVIYSQYEFSDLYRALAIFRNNSTGEEFLLFDYQLEDYKNIKKSFYNLLSSDLKRRKFYDHPIF